MKFYLTKAGVLLANCVVSSAFSTQFTTLEISPHRSEKLKYHSSSPTALFYRQASEDDADDEATLQSIKIRTPPGFQVKESIAPQGKPRNGMNMPLIKALYLNQALNLAVFTAICFFKIFGLNAMLSLSFLGDLNDTLRWTGTGPDIFDFSITAERIQWGFVGVIPLMALNNFVENSDNRAFSNVNLSTITLALTMFGRRKPPPPEFLPPRLRGMDYPTTSWLAVFVQSALLSLAIGFSEESVFRRMVPAALIAQGLATTEPLIVLGSAVAFGLGHLQPKSGLQENAVVFTLQLINGLGFGAIYVLSGGDLVPAIIAHAIYDFVAFFSTWMKANAQIEYAEVKSLEPFDASIKSQVQAVFRSTRARVDENTLNAAKRLFYTFDFDRNGSLSLSEVRKGVAYWSIERKVQSPPQAVIDQAFRQVLETREDTGQPKDRLSFADFLLLTIMTSRESVARLEEQKQQQQQQRRLIKAPW